MEQPYPIMINSIGNEPSAEAVLNTPSPNAWVEVNNPIEAIEVLDDISEIAKNKDYIVAAYYFGNFHMDPRNEAAHGKGWTEWQLVREAKPRFLGHKQPKVPFWGFEDDSDPEVFERKIAAASDASVSAFIFDWYWYNDGPFLEAALEEGYLKASNREDVKFAIMWANHDWFDIHPAKLGSPPHLQFPGQITAATFDKMTTHIVDRYFSQDNYLKIDGCPYFSIYELYRFVLGIGDSEKAGAELQKFRDKVKAAGFKDLHLNAVTWGVQLLPGEGEAPDLKTLLERLKVDSTTSYVWIHHTQLSTFPVTEYNELAVAYEKYRSAASEELGKPYFPNVSVGWDSSPRACQSDIYANATYPFMPVVQGNSPDRFGEALSSAKEFLDSSIGLTTKLLTINSWNEWTEGSYLEPDTENRFAYLDQIHKVFGEA
ncbi:hypothetical protein EG329_000316 [Mollisiaceae sp. DMI_Dod_QoI]|nr:hypothetical protein EG329_000316 [Helotiales sp. DMI_Dod_QoI]